MLTDGGKVVHPAFAKADAAARVSSRRRSRRRRMVADAAAPRRKGRGQETGRRAKPAAAKSKGTA